MQQWFEYYGRVQGFRGSLLGLPAWARLILFILALPGILLLSLSIVAVVVSLLAPFLLTAPAYRFLRGLTARPGLSSPVEEAAVSPTTGRRHVDVRIIE